ncbi:unnamed protein product [Linum trigynum]|uniref:Uncharacterized protein n=1 Tax=Linum trigynum TaxID=586398 RepID=A0AAV2FD17_9ROSI
MFSVTWYEAAEQSASFLPFSSGLLWILLWKLEEQRPRSGYWDSHEEWMEQSGIFRRDGGGSAEMLKPVKDIRKTVRDAEAEMHPGIEMVRGVSGGNGCGIVNGGKDGQ